MAVKLRVMHQNTPSKDSMKDADTEAQEMGARVARLRNDMGWSQGALARSLAAAGFKGAHQTTVSRIEKGERAVTLHEAYIIAEVFGISLDDLSGRKEGPRVDGAAGIREAIRILTTELHRVDQ